MRKYRSWELCLVPLLSCCLCACGPEETEDSPFGGLPYPVPEEGSLRRSIALTKKDGGICDLLLEGGCATYAEVVCKAPFIVERVTFWRYCLSEGRWKELPEESYQFVPYVPCHFGGEVNGDPAIQHCLTGLCDENNQCTILTTNKTNEYTEAKACGSHVNGSEAGIYADRSWGRMEFCAGR